MAVIYHKVAERWELFGSLLEIPKGTLAFIAEKYQRHPYRCLEGVLETRLERIHPPASWATIIEAVESLGEEQLGRRLRKRYLHYATSSSHTLQQGAYICSVYAETTKSAEAG